MRAHLTADTFLRQSLFNEKTHGGEIVIIAKSIPYNTAEVSSFSPP
jgi:hypothetical protein